MHGFSGATTIHDVAEDDDGRDLIVLYVGDYDPSGLYMSEHDLPDRLTKYGGDHVALERIALTRKQTDGLPPFPASDKRKDPRHKWFVRHFGDRCWELDALDPNDLRALRRGSNSGRDRADRVGTLRSGEPGRAGVAADDPR